MENLPTLAAALRAPSPTQLQTLPLEIRYRIYESLIDLPCKIIVGINRFFLDAPSNLPPNDKSRGNLGPLAESCKQLREEIYAWAPVLESRGIVLSKAFGVVDPKVTTFEFNWTCKYERLQQCWFPAPQVHKHSIEAFALWKECMKETEIMYSMFWELERRFMKRGKEYRLAEKLAAHNKSPVDWTDLFGPFY